MMKRRARDLLLVAALLAVASQPTALQRPSTGPSPVSLAAAFSTGGMLEDRNDDAAIDFVSAAITVAPEAGAAGLAAAADIAARLGFETSAMDLPLPSDPSHARVEFVVGGPMPQQTGAPRRPFLGPAEGLVHGTAVDGQIRMTVLGADDAGLAAAAMYVAGRLPYAWDPKGPTVNAVADDVRTFLNGQGIAVAAIVPAEAVVKQRADSLERLTILVRLTSAADSAKVARALRSLAATSSKRALSYAGIKTLEIRLATGPNRESSIELLRTSAPDPDAETFGRRPGSGPKLNVDLSNLYSVEGLLGDSDENLTADRTDAVVTFSGDGARGVVDLAARIGLESTGVSVPLVRPAEMVRKPESEPTLVIVGVSHPLLMQLIKEKKYEPTSLAPGEGTITLVRRAFGEKSAIVVVGGDARGLERALRQLAERFPHIWERGKDRTTLDDVEDDARKFLAGRTPAGQAAMALYKIDRAADELAGKDLDTARVTVFVEKPQAGLADLIRQQAARIKAHSMDVSVQPMDIRSGRALLDERWDIPSEVDDFWKAFRTRVVPMVRRNQPVVVEARLSEPPEVRARLQAQALAELTRSGAAREGTSVTVLSAYKQGYSWLYDVVRPQLIGKPIDQITIRFAELGPPSEWTQQGMFAPTRWLLEIYPIAEVLAHHLKLDLSKIRFEMAPIGSPAYDVTVTAPGGGRILHQTFEPKLVVRTFFDQFPDYERVRVTTGWLTAAVAGRVVADDRIVTDPERFWDQFQRQVLRRLYDHTMKLGEGKPKAEDAPFFGELTVDLTMSEPDYPLPVDQEQISSMEAIHEEIYFNTIHFFDVLGRYARGPALAYPGRIIPVMHPKADGSAGHAHVTLTGFDAPRPMVRVDYRDARGQSGEVRLDVPKIAVDRPISVAARVRDGVDGLEQLELRVKVDTHKDERPSLIERAAADRVDRTIISAEQVQSVLGHLAHLRAAGLYRDALAYHDLRELRVTAAWEHDAKPEARTTTALPPNGEPASWPDIRRRLPAGWTPTAVPTVQWETPIPPDEAYEILAKMSTFPEAHVYKLGESYLGREIWAMDLMPPVNASHWSQFKATTLKPTVVYSARQHANEVSSTSHTLKLAELLLTNPDYRKKLQKVNVVFHPITNPDGAQLAYDLQKITPNYMLHAGYLGALGVDVTANQWETDTMYPETQLRPKLWRTWLPDIFLNPHGYPMHEWVQLFSEYAAWVRTRAVETRDYWTMRGWWMPGFAWLDDPKYPRHKAEQFKLRSMIAANINAAPDVRALNERSYERYRRYTFAFDKKNFKLDFTDGVLMYTSIKGGRSSPQAPDFMLRNPNVTIWEGSTEAPDETARGDWLKLVASAGLRWDTAVLDYLVQGDHTVERKVEPFWDGVSLSITRPRPPKLPEEKSREKTTS